MGSQDQKKNLALVIGNVPTVDEIDQFQLIKDIYNITVISSESICGYLTQTSFFQDLRCIACKDNDENTTFLPGLEKALEGQDVVIVKERLGMYAFQAIKAKWRNRFRLICWLDNLTPYPGEDVSQIRTIRQEITAGADAFIVQSKAAAQVLKLEGIEDERILEFKPYAKTHFKRSKKLRAKAAQKLGFADTDIVIAHIGQIEFEESLFDLAYAIKLLETTDKSLASRIKVAMCGIGSASGDLSNILVTLGIDRQVTYVAPNRDAFTTIMAAADCWFFSPITNRDRVEGDPYRVLAAMAYGIPIMSCRAPLNEEYIGKHRLDYCVSNPQSLAESLKKIGSAKTLVHNMAKKNSAVVEKEFSEEVVRASMLEVLSKVIDQQPTVNLNAIDHQVAEIESLVQTKQYLAAIDAIEEVFKNKELPMHHRANLLRLIGDSFVKLGDSEAGKNAYMQCIEADPYSAKAYIGLGTIHLTKSSNDVAVVHFQKAISLAPQDEMANLGLGLAFQGLGEFDEANRWVKKSLEMDPNNTVAIFTLVQIAYERNQYSDVEAALLRYIEVHPNDHNMMFTLAGVYYKENKLGKALETVERITKVDPLDERANTLRKQIQVAMKQTAAAPSNG